VAPVTHFQQSQLLNQTMLSLKDLFIIFLNSISLVVIARIMGVKEVCNGGRQSS